MKTQELLVSSVHITEDEYNYRGLFILSKGDKTMEADISDLDIPEKLSEIQAFFGLEEPADTVRNQLMEMIMDKASLHSVINEGENYNESSSRHSVEKSALSLDRS